MSGIRGLVGRIRELERENRRLSYPTADMRDAITRSVMREMDVQDYDYIAGIVELTFSAYRSEMKDVARIEE